MVYLLKMVIFYSYVKLPEGIYMLKYYIHLLQLLTYSGLKDHGPPKIHDDSGRFSESKWVGMQAAGMQKKNGGDNDGFPTVGVQQQPFCGDITGCNMYNKHIWVLGLCITESVPKLQFC